MTATATRVILLGASNLRLGLGTILRVLTSHFDRPLTAFVACGFGRSYGQWTWAPFRGLPGIADCALWDALDDAPSRPLALITDIGNDLLIMFDRGHLNQIVWNLVRNAWQHCRKEEGSIGIAARAGYNVIFSVARHFD